MKNHIAIGRAGLHERIERRNGHHLCIKTTFNDRLPFRLHLTFMGGLRLMDDHSQPVLFDEICLDRQSGFV